jgi:hypothetical protein
MAEPRAERSAIRSQFALGAALALLASIFAVAIPLMAYVCDGFFLVYESTMPKLSGLVVASSPWAPLLVAAVGCVALLVKERKLSAAVSLKWNIAAILAVVLIGGFFLIVCCILPMATLMRSMNGQQWW